jgi:hypothetical protein
MADLTAMRAAFHSDPALEGFDKTIATGELAQYQHYESLATEATWHGFKAGAAWNAKPAAQVSEVVPSAWDDPRFQKLAHALYVEGLDRDSSGHVQTKALANYIDARVGARPATEQADVPTSDAARDVLAERERQQKVEGWTTEHDDEHGWGQMALAAAAYALNGSSDGRVPGDADTPSITERIWPWARSWFKSSGRRRNLVKAGALILAEIERLDRLAKRGQP